MNSSQITAAYELMKTAVIRVFKYLGSNSASKGPTIELEYHPLLQGNPHISIHRWRSTRQYAILNLYHPSKRLKSWNMKDRVIITGAYLQHIQARIREVDGRNNFKNQPVHLIRTTNKHRYTKSILSNDFRPRQ